MTEPAKHLTRFPQDLYAEVQKTADEQGVSANAFIVAVVAAALGYKLPKGSAVLLALTESEAWTYWHAAGNSGETIEEVAGKGTAATFERAHRKFSKALPKK